MASQNFKANLSRGVGRRIFVLFLIASLVPVLFTLGLAQFEISSSHAAMATDTMKARAKEFGFNIKTRIDYMALKSEELVDRMAGSGLSVIADEDFLIREFDHVWDLAELPPVGVSRGGDGVFTVSGSELETVRTGRRQLLVSDQGNLVLLGSTPQKNASVYAFQLSPTAVWGNRESLPANMEFCVFRSTGTRLYCTWEAPADIRDRVLQTRIGPSMSLATEFVEDDLDQYAILWQLFLKGSFAAENLDIVVVQPKKLSKDTATEIKKMFLPSAALVLVLVCALTYYQIGGNLRPLHYLTRASGRLAGGDFDTRVYVKTGDEFEQLGDAFNNMATRIGRQVTALEAMSGVDQLILAGAKLDEIANDVIKHLIRLTDCHSAGVIVRDANSPSHVLMTSQCGNLSHRDRISVLEPGLFEIRQPVQFELDSNNQKIMPFARRFGEYGQQYIVAIPCMQKDELKGILLVGCKQKIDLSKPGLTQCEDLAGRIAVALSSVEREEALYRQAHFDPLTGLPNRQLLKDRLAQYLTSARVVSNSGAILFMDLDRFKEINDVFGHSVGDEVLTKAADRIVAQVREHDTVARLGGDEFVVLLPNVDSDSTVRRTAERLLSALRDSFNVRDNEHYVSASIGIAMFPEDGATVETLLKNADAAMYRAKDGGRNRFEFFSKQLNAESRRKITIERDLRTAFQNGDLEVYYQPQFEIATNDVSGAEALLRWRHPKRGAISPAEFIPLAEDSELIVEIGAWVVEQACEDLRSLLERDLHPGSVSINVSARQLADKSFRNAVLQPMRNHGVNPAYMQLEVTETTVAQNKDIAVAVLQSLREEGVSVAIDDFGTGYSSLSYLEQMPFDVIKIDKSFISRIGTSLTSDNICRTIIKMAEQLGKESIAEGVETDQQLQFLKASKCTYLQGYYFSHPLPADEFKEFVAKQDFHTKRRKALEIL